MKRIIGKHRRESRKILGIEKGLNKTAKIEYEKIQPGDVKRTYSDIDYTKEKLSIEPSISINEGILKFISWYKKINIT